MLKVVPENLRSKNPEFLKKFDEINEIDDLLFKKSFYNF